MLQVRLLIELGLVQPEGVDDVNDGLRRVIAALLGFFGGGVGADVDIVVADGDLLAVGFVDGAVDLFEFIGVGDQLVAGEDVLGKIGSAILQHLHGIFAAAGHVRLLVAQGGYRHTLKMIILAVG